MLLKIHNNISLIAIAVILYGLMYGRHYDLETATDIHPMFFSSGLLKCIAGMSLGVSIINSTFNTNNKKKFNLSVLIIQTSAILYTTYFIFTIENIPSYDSITIVCFYYIFYSLVNYKYFWNRIFSHCILVHFGNISFAIYLFHTPLIIFIRSSKIL